ncbi:MAG: hypothetical protein IJH36_13985, partial [Clostridia bacterium]|nr:hypothetical protein [Clostridia bacterium]
MRKIISFILCLAMSITLFAIPVHAESNIYSAYLDVLNDAVSRYGEYEKHSFFESTGVGYVGGFDFDGDGINELLFCTGEISSEPNTAAYIYKYHVYGYKNGSAILLTEGSMDAHGGDSNWEIGVTYNQAKSRLLTYRYDGAMAQSEYITVGEYDGNTWQTYTDWFVDEFIEYEPGGSGYDVYYIGGEQVGDVEYQNRFNSLGRGGGFTQIKWTDFNGSYLEEYGQGLSDMNYWFGDKTDTLNNATTNDYYQENYKKYISALYEAFNNQYIDPYSGK